MLYDINITMKNGIIRLYYDICHVSIDNDAITISYDERVICYPIKEIETLSICTTTH